MADNWAGSSANPVARAKQFVDEDSDDLKDNWDDESEEEPEPEPPKPQPKPKKKEESAENYVDTSKMTAKEREDYARQQELNSMMETFGTSDNAGGDFFDLESVKSKTDFADLADRIANKLKSKQKSEHYKEFVQTLFIKLCETVEPKDIRLYSSVLSEKARQMQDAEKEKKKTKKAKPTLKAGKKDDLYSDIVGDGFATSGADVGGDFDDFM